MTAAPLALGSSRLVALAWAAAAYIAWLRWGMRPNPPVPYDKFTTGYSFDGIRQILKHEQNTAYRAGQYMFVTRATVLGRWHELKQDQYSRYLDHYEEGDEELPF